MTILTEIVSKRTTILLEQYFIVEKTGSIERNRICAFGKKHE